MAFGGGNGPFVGGVHGTFEVEIENQAELDALFTRIDAYASDMTVVNKNVVELAADLQREKIDLGTDADGVPFADLVPWYQEAKDKLYPGEPILVATGALYESISSDYDESGGEAGPTDPKAVFHASLDARRTQKLRDFVSVEEESFGEDVEEIGANWIDRAIES